MTLPLGSARFTCGLWASAVSVAMLASGCSKDTGSEAGDDGISGSGIPGDGDGDDDNETSGGMTSADTDVKFDMPEETDSDTEVPCGEGELCEGECEIPPHTPCDANANTPIVQALGLNCPGDVQVDFATNGSAAAIGTRSSFGGMGAFPPQEGSQYVVIGSGRTDELDNALGCNSDLGAQYDPLTLPAPMVGTNVGGQTCAENPALIGTGDCSNTIENQLAGTVNDYTELRITAQVPTTVNSFSYSLAYMSYEYPQYYLSAFNDMYIGWLESEVWTGNVSFDEQGAPISLNAGFLDYRDANAPNDPMCQGNCSAPEIHGTCMQGHAATKWLTTSAGVKPGETITIVLSIFDMTDSILDSYAFVDNFQWGCEGDQPPSTVPIE
jgi:hypothetical protein